ncbi:hypothetical protein Hypma_016585 [Hypsizygus marmoreus]|uniref:Uncharacterized protein n=1 Tax=Hypsizygus marmoreus TaxID=39966 RepID=A0A369J7B2_HYPMA|nr:hypothetical protein Hypma_016585 [Hypsizygus marmoreus]
MSPPSHAPPPPSNTGHINGPSSPRGAWNPPEDNFWIPPPSSIGSSSGPLSLAILAHLPIATPAPQNHRFVNATGASSSLGRGPPQPPA